MATLRQDADRIIQAALAAALPDNAVKKALAGHSFSADRVRLEVTKWAVSAKTAQAPEPTRN